MTGDSLPVGEIVCGDCLQVMRGWPDGCIDAIVTDPPYGLSFMGKRWDYDVPSVEIWTECLRVLKDGGRLLAFSGARTQHRMVCRIEDAGFVIEDCMMWLYGSGFPKHKSKLKPAYEPICVARKGSVSELNIDAGRIATSDHYSYPNGAGGSTFSVGGGTDGTRTAPAESHPAGRWPANVCMDEAAAAALDQQSGVRASGAWPKGEIRREGVGSVPFGSDSFNPDRVDTDSGGASRFMYVAKADRAERDAGCGAIALGSNMRVNAPRASEAHKHATRLGNTHPTVKPVELMRWLIRLVAQPGQVVLDPFFGSGTTGVAANREGIGWIGIELNPDYAEIARARTAQQGLFAGAADAS